MRNFSVLALLAIIIISCKGSSDFKKINDFKNSEWLLANQQVFEFEIKEVGLTYQLGFEKYDENWKLTLYFVNAC